MSVVDPIKSENEQRMSKTLEALKKEFSRVRTGRASLSLLDGITVDYYGSNVPVQQAANISIPDARMIMIQPWDKSMLPTIEKAVLASNVGLTPQNDGNIIRLPIPPLSEERRKELFKSCKKIAEECKVAVRNIRRDTNDRLKKAEKEKKISQDEQKKALDEIQKITDRYTQAVDDQLQIKEKEIMET